MSVSMSAERVPDRQLVGTPAPQPGRGCFRNAEKENRASPMMNNSIPLSPKRRDEHFARKRVLVSYTSGYRSTRLPLFRSCVVSPQDLLA